MQHYFFHVQNGQGYTRDDEGRELRDLEEARREAIIGIRSILADELTSGIVDLRGRLDICDRDDALLLSVAFHEVVELRLTDGDTA
jgi:hypothetical protein